MSENTQFAQKAVMFGEGDGDIGAAAAFANGVRNKLLHDGARWLMWDGARWIADVDGFVTEQAKQVTADMWKRQGNLHKSRFTKRGLQAMIDLAASDPELRKRQCGFDNDRMSLNCANGIVDLATGASKTHNYELNTLLAGCNYDPDAACPRWDKFLVEIFPDSDVRRFIQTAVGYTLTGSVREQVLFFLHGAGSNGKSVFMNVVYRMMGDYAKRIASDAIMSNDDGKGATPQLARLPGARLVIASEIEQGRKLRCSFVKDITGGDVVIARALYKEPVEFAPQFKLWLYGNHEPQIDGVDDGIWRRIIKVPFTQQFSNDPDKQKQGALPKDENLEEVLLSELPGILAWAVRGALEYTSNGLSIPASIQDATQAYRQEQDIFGLFLSECTRPCVKGAHNTTRAALFVKHTMWARANGYDELTSKAFGSELKQHGVKTYSGTGNVTRIENVEII